MTNVDVTGEPLLHVVLHQPDIPQNTGNIGRTCVAVGAKLWLIRPLGFRLDEQLLRRAGMDYWELVDWEAVDSWAELKQKLAGRPWWALTKTGTRLLWDARFRAGRRARSSAARPGACPPSILGEQPDEICKLPMRPEVRSLNLASTVNTVVYEAVRQFGGLPRREGPCGHRRRSCRLPDSALDCVRPQPPAEAVRRSDGMGVKKSGKGRRKLGRKKRRNRSKIRHRKG